jgi:hypothetical protein
MLFNKPTRENAELLSASTCTASKSDKTNWLSFVGTADWGVAFKSIGDVTAGLNACGGELGPSFASGMMVPLAAISLL